MARGAGVWRAGAALSGVCGGLFWLVLQARVSRAVLCRSVPRRRVVLWRVAPWGALSWCVALWRAAVRCAVLPCVVPWWVGGGQPGFCLGAECGSECGWLVAGGCG